MKYRTVFAILLLFSVSLSLALAVSTVQRKIPSRGTVFIKTFGVEAYWDSGCTTIVTEIDWGTLEPGDGIGKTIYLKNTGNTAITLTLTTEAWSPAEAANYITLTWDAESTSLAAGAVKPATLTLTVSPSIAGIQSYTFNIVITGQNP